MNNKKEPFEITLLKIALFLAFIGLVNPKTTTAINEKIKEPIAQTFSDIVKSDKNEKKNDQSFALNIEKINVKAPIIPGVDDTNEQEYLKAIENGLALSINHASSPLQTGNMFIYGHSSYFRNKPGKYKEVFRDLNRLRVNDMFTIQYQGKTFNYQVFKSKETGAKDFSVLTLDSIRKNKKTVTLMTCWPIGSTDKRWIVLAQQI